MHRTTAGPDGCYHLFVPARAELRVCVVHPSVKGFVGAEPSWSLLYGDRILETRVGDVAESDLTLGKNSYPRTADGGWPGKE